MSTQWATDALRLKFNELGMGALYDLVLSYVQSGTDNYDDILVRLQYDPSAQKVIQQRFPALAKRANSPHPISIRDYLDLEDAYRSIVRNAGLPKGFYDQNTDYTKWIEDGTAPTEIQARINTAASAAMNADPYVKQALREYYGVDDAGIMAHFLDPKTAADVLTTQYGAAQAGAAYRAQGMSLSKGLAEEIGLSASNVANAAAGANQVAEDAPAAAALSNIWGEDLSSEDLTRDTFNLSGGAQARRKRNRLASQERAAFSGSSGTQAGSLAGSGASGQI